MGSWTSTCSLSNLPIQENDAIYLIPTIYGEVCNSTGLSYQFDSVNNEANIIGLPIEGTYDSYGGININLQGLEASILFKCWFLDNYMIPIDKPDNYYSLSNVQRFRFQNQGIFSLISEGSLNKLKSFKITLENLNDRHLECLEYHSYSSILEYSEDNQKIVPKSFFNNLSPEDIINNFIERETIAIRSEKQINRLGFVFILKEVYDQLKKENNNWFKQLPSVKNLSEDISNLLIPWKSLSNEEKKSFKENFFIKNKDFEDCQYQAFFEMNRNKGSIFKAIENTAIFKDFFINMIADLYFDSTIRNKKDFNNFVKSYIEMQKIMIMINRYNCSLFPKPSKGGKIYNYDHIQKMCNVISNYIEKKEKEREF